jgi:DMSO reductase anchor subunit
MVYAVTRRAWWALPRTAARFAATSLALGTATVLVTTLISAVATGRPAGAQLDRPLALAVVAVTVTKLVAEAAFLVRHRRAGAPAELHRSALLLVGPLWTRTRQRFAAGLAGALLAVAVTLPGVSPTTALGLGVASFAAVLAGELLERWQFFTAAAPPRMPDGR